MKTKNVIIVLVILGLIALGGAYMLGLFDNQETEVTKTDVEESADITREDEESEPSSETVADAPKTETADETEADKDEPTPSVLSTEYGLVAYYPFNEDIKDYAGKEIDATNHNAFFVDGKKGKALKFNGQNSYVHVAVDINPSEMPQMTMAVWAKAEKGSVVVRQIIGNDNDEYDRTIVTDFRGGGKGWSCFAGDGRVLGYEPVVADKWTFIAAVYDQNAGTVKLFVDGSIYEKNGKMVDEGTPFILIGARGSTENNSHPFKGAIDEVKIYSYALSDQELNSLYKTGIARPETE